MGSRARSDGRRHRQVQTLYTLARFFSPRCSPQTCGPPRRLRSQARRSDWPRATVLVSANFNFRPRPSSPHARMSSGLALLLLVHYVVYHSIQLKFNSLISLEHMSICIHFYYSTNQCSKHRASFYPPYKSRAQVYLHMAPILHGLLPQMSICISSKLLLQSAISASRAYYSISAIPVSRACRSANRRRRTF